MDEIDKFHKPEPRQVWEIPDEKIVLHKKGKKKKSRYGLVLSAICDELDLEVINIIPLTTVREFDTLTFPMKRAYKKIEPCFKPKNNSTAVMQFYQPIMKKYFIQLCGEIDIQTYNAIKMILCKKIIGLESLEFDLEPD